MRDKIALATILILAVLATLAWEANNANGQEKGAQEGLVSWWTFDKKDIDGTTVKDVVGDNDGSMMGAPKSVAGVCNEALEFDGVDDRVVVKADASLNSEKFTIEMLLKPVTIRPFDGQWPNIIMGREVYQKSGFRYRITAGGNIRFWTGESGGTLDLGSATVISTGSFYHVVTTYDGSEARIYINGSLDASQVGTYIVPVATDLSIVDGVGGTKPANVIIDEVRIYERALTYSLPIEWVGILRLCAAQPALFSRHLSATETKSVVREHLSYGGTNETYVSPDG